MKNYTKPADRNRDIKKYLLKKTGNKNIQVVGGKGTSYGWVDITVNLINPGIETIGSDGFYSMEAKKLMHGVSTEIENLVVDKFDQDLFHYYDDMTTNRIPCLVVQTKIK